MIFIFTSIDLPSLASAVLLCTLVTCHLEAIFKSKDGNHLTDQIGCLMHIGSTVSDQDTMPADRVRQVTILKRE